MDNGEFDNVVLNISGESWVPARGQSQPQGQPSSWKGEAYNLADRVTELLAAIREHREACKADYGMPDGKTKVEGGEEYDRKLWSHLPDEG